MRPVLAPLVLALAALAAPATAKAVLIPITCQDAGEFGPWLDRDARTLALAIGHIGQVETK
jgi:hypothetical protein